MLGLRYRESLRDIFERQVLADDFSLYLHRTTATDPSLAPPGCDAFYVLSPVPNLGGDTDWTSAAEPYRQAIATHLSAIVLPDLEKHVVTLRLMTPPDFQDRLFAWQGAAFGLEPVLLQSARFRPHNRSEDIAGLYLVGAGTHPGAGVPGVSVPPLLSTLASPPPLPAARLADVDRLTIPDHPISERGVQREETTDHERQTARFRDA